MRFATQKKPWQDAQLVTCFWADCKNAGGHGCDTSEKGVALSSSRLASTLSCGGGGCCCPACAAASVGVGAWAFDNRPVRVC